MNLILHILISAAIFFLFFSFSYGQDKNIDKIEMLYDQGNYAKVLKTTKKLQTENEYNNNAPLKLFEALSEYQLSKTRSKFKQKSAIENFKRFISWDTISEYEVTYDIYIYDLQIGLVNEIRKLEKDGKSKEAAAKYIEYSNLFEHKASFSEITATKPEVITTTPEIIIAEDAPEKIKEVSINKQQKNIIKEAKKHLGTKYKFGGITPKGFDCSGFTQYVLAKNNITIPRTSKAQANTFEKVKQKNAQVGDLAFFGVSKSKINHVGIISKVERNKLYMIHASTSRGIMITEITTNIYWSKKLQFITRTLEK